MNLRFLTVTSDVHTSTWDVHAQTSTSTLAVHYSAVPIGLLICCTGDPPSPVHLIYALGFLTFSLSLSFSPSFAHFLSCSFLSFFCFRQLTVVMVVVRSGLPFCLSVCLFVGVTRGYLFICFICGDAPSGVPHSLRRLLSASCLSVYLFVCYNCFLQSTLLFLLLGFLFSIFILHFFAPYVFPLLFEFFFIFVLLLFIFTSFSVFIFHCCVCFLSLFFSLFY